MMMQNVNGREARRIQRAMFLAAGIEAQRIADTVLTLGRQCLGIEPPLQVLSLNRKNGSTSLSRSHSVDLPVHDRPATDQDGSNPLTVACDRLASRGLLNAMRQAGWLPVRLDEMQVWLILDVATLPAGDSDDAFALLSPLTMVKVIMRERLRVNVVPFALLITEPSHNGKLVRWASSLKSLGVSECYVASPVNHDHVRLEDGVWQDQAAAALAALLWGASPDQLLEAVTSSSAVARNGPALKSVWAIGGVLQQPAISVLKAELTRRWALHVVRRLQGSTVLLPDEEADLGTHLAPPTDPEIAPAGRRQSLRQAIPPPPARRNSHRWPGWTSLSTLAADMRAEADNEAKYRRSKEYHVREAWLAAQIRAWRTDLEQLSASYLQPPHGWPDPSGCQRHLATVRKALQEALEQTETWLHEASQRYERVQTILERAGAALEGLCRGFPEPGWRGLWTALTHPWRWLRWAQDYFFSLPQATQRFQDALNAAAHATWHEANAHLVRQLHLGMAQDVVNQNAALDHLMEVLANCEGTLNTREETDLGNLPAPWTEAGLQAYLARQPLHQPPDLGWLFEGLADGFHRPITSDQDMREAASPGQAGAADLATWLRDWAQNQLEALSEWTVVDYLAMALTETEMDLWLQAFIDTALPLWPQQELAVDVKTSGWLWAPAVAIDSDGILNSMRHVESVRLGVGNLDALVVLRRSEIDLALEEEEACDEHAGLAGPDLANVA